jgi:hypothetical protein
MLPVDESRACIALFVATINVVPERTGETEPMTFTFFSHVGSESNDVDAQPCTLRDKEAKYNCFPSSDNAGAVDVAQFTSCKGIISNSRVVRDPSRKFEGSWNAKVWREPEAWDESVPHINKSFGLLSPPS